MIISNTLTGVLHGRTIELDQSVAIADGQRVEVVIRAVPAEATAAKPGDGIRASAGAWAGADNQEFDRWLKETYDARSQNRELR